MGSRTTGSQAQTSNFAVTADDDSSINDAIFEILPENIPNTIIHKAPEERFRLGTWTVIGLVVNRTIGTGIFNSPSTIIRGTHSVGITLLFWLAGAVFTIAGTHLVIEFGLSIPRYTLDGVDQAIPRSGGVLNYLQYMYPKPSYRPNSVLLITCLFGAAYIILGNMAGNCLVFGIRSIDAAGLNSADYDGTVRGIAVGVATFACLIHTVSRRGGIWLGNLFALIKVLILTLIIILGFCAWGNVFEDANHVENMSVNSSFKDAATEPYGYVSAFLAVIFAWSGFDQPTYVLGEIGTPRKKFPWGTGIGVAIVIVLYMLVNVAYMIVVPKEIQIAQGTNVALEFFKATLGQVDDTDNTPQRVLSAFLAISSFGNIMVMTYVAARVKQEIAKEGILPFARYFGSNTNLSFGRFLARIQRKDTSFANRHLGWLLKHKWMSISEHSQETPFGALSLHWLFTIVMIVATIRLKPASAYVLLVNLYSYTVVSVFGCLLGIGMLMLRFSPKEKWRKKSPANPFFSILAATVFFVGCGYPVIASCVPPTNGKGSIAGVAWYTTPVVAACILAFGLAWYTAFNVYASWREKREGLEFRVQKVPEFDKDGGADGLPVQVHETVYIAWSAKEANTVAVRVESRSSHESF